MATASPVAARTRAPKFSGAAPGSVTCSVSAKVSFSPPLTNKGGGTSSSAISAKLSSCSPSNHAITIKSAKATGSFVTSPYSCVTMASTGAAATLSISWKANLNGTVSGTTYAGKATFPQTRMSGITDTGSFAGDASLSLPVPGSDTSGCTSKKGIKKLTLSGTMTLGTSGSSPPPPSPGVSSVSYDGFDGYCAVMTSGGVECWGYGGDGELGNGSTGDSDVPVAVCAVGQSSCTATSNELTGVSSLADNGYESYSALLTSGGGRLLGLWG